MKLDNKNIQEKSCGCVIIEDNKVLLIKQTKGHWDFPKGHMEKGETEVQTAVREVKEETGIDVKVKENKRYSIEYITDKGKRKKVVFFLAEKIGGKLEPQKSEIDEIQWLDFNKAMDIITYSNSKNLFKNIILEIKGETDGLE